MNHAGTRIPVYFVYELYTQPSHSW